VTRLRILRSRSLGFA